MTNQRARVLVLAALGAVAAAGCVASDAPLPDPAPPIGPGARDPILPVELEGISHVGYDSVLDRLYVATDSVVHAIDLADSNRTALLSTGAPIVALEVSGDGVLALAKDDGQNGRLFRVGHGGEIEKEMEIALHGPDFPLSPILRQIDPDTVVVIDNLGGPGMLSIVVDLASGQIQPSDGAVYSFVYQDPGVAVQGGRLFLPSAYPGEVIEASVSAAQGLYEVRRVYVNDDWLHDVAMLDERRALVAGHLAGVGVVELVDTPDFKGAPYTPLFDLLWAYSLVGDRHAYSAAHDSLGCIDTRDLTSWTLHVAAFDTADAPFHNDVTPIGERAPGRVLIHKPGAGVVEVDCAAESQ